MIGVSCFIGNSRKNILPKDYFGNGYCPVTFENENFDIRLRAISESVGYSFEENDNFIFICFGDIYSLDSSSLFDKMIAGYKKSDLKNVMKNLKGYFSLFLYDKNESQLVVCSDRYALKSVYINTIDNKIISISNDINEIVFQSEFECDIDHDALSTFLNVGHFMENNTLFKNVERVSPATIYYINTRDNSFSSENYWSWSCLDKNDDITFEDATDTLYLLFRTSVKDCLEKVNDDKLSICLSGGLDSRVLLAEAVEQFEGEIETFTFGKLGCLDFKLAKEVADIAKVKANFFTVDEDNWYKNRVDGVLLTGGMFNVTHMHSLVAVDSISDYSRYMLNGYLGDAVLGGSYLSSVAFDKKNDFSIATTRYGSNAKYIDFDNHYYNFPSTDPSMVISNRGNRFTSGGTDLISSKVNNLKPFMNSDMLDFIYTLPDAYRYNSRIYNAMLLKYYPRYFSAIPWQNTGKVIGVDWSEGASGFNIKDFTKNIIKGTMFESLVHKFYIKNIIAKKNFVDYPTWMRSMDFLTYLDDLSRVELHADIENKDFIELVDRFKHDFTITPDRIGCWITIFEYLSVWKKCRENSYTSNIEDT